MRGRGFAVIVLIGVALAGSGCGAHRVAPVDPRASGPLTPAIEDGDGGLVGVAPDFTPKAYTAVVLEPFTVDRREIKDDDDARLAKDMSAYLHAQLLKRLQAASIFTAVIDGATTPGLAPQDKRLRLQGDITRLTEGNQAMRYFVGFGAGAAKTQIETRLVDDSSRQIKLVTADRRAAAMGIFGGDGRQFVTESMDQMAEGLVKLLARLAAGDKPGPVSSAGGPSPRR